MAPLAAMGFDIDLLERREQMRQAGSRFPFPCRISMYYSMSDQELKEEAAMQYLDATGTRADVVDRLKASDELGEMYDQWHLGELIKVLDDRGVKWSDVGRAYQSFQGHCYLVGRLRDATSKFTRFLVLPAELRNQIYQYVCIAYPVTARQHPRVPAICRASKQLRQESLPVFFGMNTFMITVQSNKTENYWDSTGRFTPAQIASGVNYIDTEWLRVIKKHIPLMRKIVIMVKRNNYIDYHLHPLTYISFSIDTQAFEIEGSKIHEAGGTEFILEEGTVVAYPEELENIIRKMAKRGRLLKKHRLKRILQSFVDMCKAWPEPPKTTEDTLYLR